MLKSFNTATQGQPYKTALQICEKKFDECFAHSAYVSFTQRNTCI
jgi:hypothetical protein